jgi:hypothetical protein
MLNTEILENVVTGYLPTVAGILRYGDQNFLLFSSFFLFLFFVFPN